MGKLAIARAYFAARHARKRNRPLPDIPVCDEGEMTANFARYNVLGLSIDEARQLALEELETGVAPREGYSLGLSTGTTGEPGVFITTQSERDLWLGNILGKFLSPGQLPGLTAALLLRRNNRLYDASGRVHYFDIGQSAAHWAPRLCDLQPNVLIGPPSVLEDLAGAAAFRRRPIRPHLLLCAAEPLFPQDGERLAKAFQTAPRNLYQAKEGFLAAGCRHGGLHWNQDLMTLELMRFKGRPDHAVPVITDFTRQSQTFHRYRIDDVIVLGPGCPCDTPFQKLATVECRLQDVLLDGENRPIFPLDMNEVLSAIGDYKLIQHALNRFTLECTATPDQDFLRRLNDTLRSPGLLDLAPLRPGSPGRKRRRFERLFDLQNRTIIEALLDPPRLV